MLKNKVIVLGVTGSIAAYKSAELVRRLKELGADVWVVMTEKAGEFVRPLTFKALSGNRVLVDMFAEPEEYEVEHVGLADKADAILIAPATADIIAKIVAGIADDMLTTLVCAANSPVLIAPAMNAKMYENPITQANIKKLTELGYKFIEPEEGFLACGYKGKGKGRLAAVDVIVEAVEALFREKDLAGLKIMVTAGPTREPIDPVRFISNYSSGKMGYTIAEVAVERGAEVVLISGPTALAKPTGVKFIGVETAEEMRQAVLANFDRMDVVIKAAAVADFRVAEVMKDKIKRANLEKLDLELVPNPDILSELGKNKGKRILVGFAAETQDLVTNAKDKLKAKNLDIMVANDLSKAGAGFAVDTNIVKIITKAGKVEDLPKLSKKEVAWLILDRVKELVELKGAAK